MRTALAVGYVLIFSLSLLAGYRVSQYIISPSLNQSDTPFSPPNLERTRQLNLLVVNVDQLEEKRPGLQVIWMVAFNPTTSIKMIPVYPSYIQDPSSDLSLSKTFGLKKNGTHFELNANTGQVLQKRGLEWDGIVILDNRALAYFIDAFGSIRVGEDLLDRDVLAAFKLPYPKNEQARLDFHTLLWREICWNILHSPENISALNNDFSKHASVLISKKVSEQAWVELLSSVRVPSCEFPMYFRANP